MRLPQASSRLMGTPTKHATSTHKVRRDGAGASEAMGTVATRASLTRARSSTSLDAWSLRPTVDSACAASSNIHLEWDERHSFTC